jgi:hypothetical protein
MAVAKTYANMKISGEPFMENKRMYVNVISPKGLKKVRWYSDAEYRRMYPQEEVKHNVMDFNARHVFGFGDLGFITIYKGDQTSLEECVETHHANFRRNLTFGYYTPSHISLCDLPTNVTPVKLLWDSVMDHDDRMKPHDVVQKIVAEKLGTLSKSKYQGAVNDWLQKTVKVTKKTSKESHFGTKHTYDFEDSDGNTYIWETGAKDFTSGETISLKMKVKEHKEIDGNEVTVVWYCKVI